VALLRKRAKPENKRSSDKKAGNKLNIHQHGKTKIDRWANPESNPEVDQFWTDLGQDAEGQWADGVLEADKDALKQFGSDLGSDADTSAGSVAIDTIDFALDIAQAAPAAKYGFKLLQRLYANLNRTRSASATLSEFLAAQRDNNQEFRRNIPTNWNRINEESPKLFRDLKRLKEAENETNRMEIRERALHLVEEARNSIPDWRVVMRRLVSAWVGGAEDQPVAEALVDPHDPSGFNTGFLRIYVDIHVNMHLDYVSHRFTAISLDDIDRPARTKQALEAAWGSDYYLDELPFPGIIFLNVGSTTVRYSKTDRSATEDLSGWEVRTANIDEEYRAQIIEDRRQMYFEHIRARIEHLRPDD